MCGRYASTREPTALVEAYAVDADLAEDLGAQYNVAPTMGIYGILERQRKDSRDVERELRALRWGLVPSWAKDLKVGSRLINARVETVATKPAFRRAFAIRRCLLPADGFYEWETTGARERGRPVSSPTSFTRPMPA